MDGIRRRITIGFAAGSLGLALAAGPAAVARRGIALALAAVFLSASVALAANGAQTTHFTAAYDNGQGGFFTCAGERIVKTAPKAVTKDSETCTISDVATWPAGTYVIGSGAFWISDFDGQVAVSGTIVVTDNGDGTGTMDIVAYF